MLAHNKLAFESNVLRGRPDQDSEFSRLNDAPQVFIKEGQVLREQFERAIPRFARLQEYFCEPT